MSADARVRRSRQQPLPPAPAARARSARHQPASAHERDRRLAGVCHRADRLRDAPARLRERRRRGQNDARPAGAAARAAFDRTPRAQAARPRGAAQRARTLDLDLLLYGRRRVHVPGLTVPHPRMHQRAFVLRPLVDIAAVATIPGRGLARRFLRGVRDQRIARTRVAFLSLARVGAGLAMDLERCRYVVVEGPIGAGKTSLAPRARAPRRRRGAVRAPGGQSVSRALLRRHGALRARRPSSRSCSSAPTSLRGVGQFDMFRRAHDRRFPARQGSAVRAAQPVRRRIPRSTRRSIRT